MSEPEPLSTRQLAKLLYAMGRTFDGLQSTFTATEEFLHTGTSSPRPTTTFCSICGSPLITPATMTMPTARLTWNS